MRFNIYKDYEEILTNRIKIIEYISSLNVNDTNLEQVLTNSISTMLIEASITGLSTTNAFTLPLMVKIWKKFNMKDLFKIETARTPRFVIAFMEPIFSNDGSLTFQIGRKDVEIQTGKNIESKYHINIDELSYCDDDIMEDLLERLSDEFASKLNLEILEFVYKIIDENKLGLETREIKYPDFVIQQLSHIAVKMKLKTYTTNNIFKVAVHPETFSKLKVESTTISGSNTFIFIPCDDVSKDKLIISMISEKSLFNTVNYYPYSFLLNCKNTEDGIPTISLQKRHEMVNIMGAAIAEIKVTF